MRHFFILAAMALAFSMDGQSLTYQIDTISRDSFFLTETFTAAPTAQAPRGQTTVNSQIFRSKEQLALFAKNVKEEADKYDQAAKILRLKSDAILDIINKNEAFFSGQPKPKKPKKGKK